MSRHDEGVEGISAEQSPLSYEQEVHAVLHAAASNTEGLIRYFEAQYAQEKGEAKKLTEKCIAWKRDDLRRISALIPQALKARELREERDVLKHEAELRVEEARAFKEDNIKLYAECERAESALASARRKTLDEAARLLRDEIKHWDYSDLATNNRLDLETFVDNVETAILALKGEPGEPVEEDK